MLFRARRIKAGPAIASINMAVRETRSALSYAADAGWIRFNPLLRWRQCQIREAERAVRVVEPVEFAKLTKATIDPTLRLLLIMAYHQRMQRAELFKRYNLPRGDNGGSNNADFDYSRLLGHKLFVTLTRTGLELSLSPCRIFRCCR